MVPATKSLRSTLFRPTAPLSGNEAPSVYRGKNLILRGPLDAPYFEVFPGNEDLGEDYDIGIVGYKQIETLTIVAAAGITGNGNADVVITIRGSEYALVVPLTTVTHTTAALIAGAVRTALLADDYITSLFTVQGTGAVVELEDLIPTAEDDSRNIYVQNALFLGCTGITNDDQSISTLEGNGTYRLTGTLAYTAGDKTITGTTTDFTNELHLGQFILAGTQLLVVASVTDDTHFECDRAPDTSESALVGIRMPQMFEIDGKRGVMQTGNALMFKGRNIVFVGSGELFINGEPLRQTSSWATNKPQAAVFSPSRDGYVINELGYTAVPPAPEVTVVTGGSGRMVVGNKHSFKVSYWDSETDGPNGYSDPCDVIKFEPGGSTPIEITAVDDQFRFDFTDCYVGLPPNAKGFIIWASRHGAKTVSVSGVTTTTTSTNESYYENGPWYRVRAVTKGELNALSLIYTFDYLDGDLYAEVSGDNNHPPDCELIQRIEGKPMYCSCFGDRTSANDLGSNPGNVCVVSKFDNPDGSPYDWSAQCNGTIIGAIEGVGRWFMMTNSHIDFIVPTGLYGQTTQGGRQVELPIVARPYWQTGVRNRYNVILSDETLIGFSGNKLFRSIGYGDENAKKYDFGAVVADITRDFTGGHVLIGEDPKNGQICVFHAAAYKNDAGYWVTRVLPYSVDIGAWLPEVVLTDDDRDMIVSGVATVDQALEFLCGGRVEGGTWEVKTYRYGTGSGVAVPAYLIWNPSDDGFENVSKQIRSIRPTGKFTNLVVQIHGARPGEIISVDNMETGDDPLAEIEFEDSDEVTRYLPQRIRVTKLGIYAVRLALEWDGTGTPDRIDEVVLEVGTHGRAR